MKRIRHPVAKSIVSLVLLFLVWKIAVAVLESLEDAQFFTLLSYSDFITKNIPFQNLEKIVAQTNCKNSTEILQYLLDNGMIDERLLVLDDNMPKRYRWQIVEEVREHEIMSENNIWSFLVSGYQDAPGDTIVAATRNVDLSHICPDDPNNREIYVFPDLDSLDILKHFACVITKDGRWQYIQKRRKKTTGEYYWSTHSKVYWDTDSVVSTNTTPEQKWKYFQP